MHPGDWIEVELTNGRHAVGRFSGIWVNPLFGVVAQTVYTKVAELPDEPPESYFFILRTNEDPKAEKGDTPGYSALRKAHVVAKPGKKAKAPAAVHADRTVH